MALEENEVFIKFLKKNKDVFAWTYTLMSGHDPKIAMHRLFVGPDEGPVKQRLKRMHPGLASKLEAEVEKLIKANFKREVEYRTSLANKVLVKKKNVQIRICIYFWDLNKACPRDDFSISHTNLLVDTTLGYGALTLIDGYSRSNQIKYTKKTRK